MAIINTINVKGISYDIGLNNNYAGDGLTIKDNKLTIDTAYGLNLYQASDSIDAGLGVMASDGIVVHGGGVAVKPGSGITVTKDGVHVQSGNGITVTTNAVSVNASTGLTFDDNKLILDYANLKDTNKEFIKAGDGIVVDNAKGISVSLKQGVTFEGQEIYVDSNGFLRIDLPSSGPSVSPQV